MRREIGEIPKVQLDFSSPWSACDFAVFFSLAKRGRRKNSFCHSPPRASPLSSRTTRRNARISGASSGGFPHVKSAPHPEDYLFKEGGRRRRRRASSREHITSTNVTNVVRTVRANILSPLESSPKVGSRTTILAVRSARCDKKRAQVIIELSRGSSHHGFKALARRPEPGRGKSPQTRGAHQINFLLG